MNRKSKIGSVVVALLVLAVMQAPARAQTVKPAERASKQMRAKQFDLALTSLTEALTDDDKNSMLYFRRAQCFYCLNRYQDAVEDFDHAIKMEPGVADFFLWRGTAEAKLGQDDAAVRDYERALRLKPELVIAYNDAHATKTSSTSESKVASSSASSPAPDKVALENKVASGSSTLDKDSPGDQSSAPKSATVGDGKSDSTENSGSQTGMAQSNTSSTAPTKEVAVTKSGAENSNSTIDLGYSAGAVKDYQEAIKRASVKSVAYFRAGTVFSGLCELDFKGKLLGTLVDCSTDGTISRRNDADYFTLKDATKDLRDADDQISQNPSSAAAYYARGRGYEQVGKDDLARADFTQAIELDHNNASFLLARAFLYHKTDEKKLADEDVRKALDIEPSLPHFVAFEPPKFVKTDTDKPAP